MVTVVASRGWFEHFKKYSNLHNILHVTGESASADKEAAAAYPAVLKKILKMVDTHTTAECRRNRPVLK